LSNIFIKFFRVLNCTYDLTYLYPQTHEIGSTTKNNALHVFLWNWALFEGMEMYQIREKK